MSMERGGGKMAKLTKFEVAGSKGDITNPTDWTKMILGGVVLLSSLSIAQRIGNTLGAKTGGIIDTSPAPFTDARPQIKESVSYEHF